MNNIFLERKLVDTVGTKSENLHLMRFIAAIMVIISHAYPISTGEDVGEWFKVLTNNQLTMGGFAVSVFFLCGGYLIAMSVEKNKTAKKYFSARVSRLIPSLFFVVLCTIIIGGFLSSWGALGYFLSADTWKYLLNVVFIRVHELPGVFVNNPYGLVVNGSLWTLSVEFICYILCFIAYKLSFLRKDRYPITIPIVLIGTGVVWWLGLRIPLMHELIRPVLLFYIGMGYWVYREHISLNVRNFVIAVIACVILFVFGQGQLAMLLCFPYIMMYIWFGMKQCSPKLGKLGNYSYGIYLWGFPVQQTIMHFFNGEKIHPMLNAVIAIPIAVLLGWITYELVENKAKGIPDKVKNFKCPHVVYIIGLICYSMRHVNWGLDLWDTGYSYSNFQYMGYDHMDPMWLFSTYLANAVGNVITKLPGADSLLGMNVYTTLFATILAVICYIFCTQKLKMTRWVVFVGELVALALCWCPHAILYNYLSYVLVVICVILLYQGLVKEKKWLLFAAGILLGANVLTRFSNLPQAALILGVWAYGVLEALSGDKKEAWKRTVNRTLWCLGGYIVGLGVLLGYIHIRYGIGEYVNGIVRLFSMTEAVEGYKPEGMLTFVISQFVSTVPWIKQFVIYILAGMSIWIVIYIIKKYVKFVKKQPVIQSCLNAIGIASSLYLIYYVANKLYATGFCDMNYYGYISIEMPAFIFMILTMVIAFIKLICKHVSKEDKLIGILVTLLLLVNSIGSSNGLYSSFNNLFLAAPYTLWNIYLFLRYAKDKICKIEIKSNTSLEIPFFAWPIKAVIIAFMYVFIWQATLFGEYFFFTEAMGASELTATVENNEMLEGIKMHPYKAEWLTTISAYVEENNLQGREVILYGYIPSMSYYLQMPPAFNSWPDLGSYNISQMKLDMEELQEQIDNGEVEAPVVLIDAKVTMEPATDKWELIQTFMEKNDYECTFYNGKFLMYETTLK